MFEHPLSYSTQLADDKKIILITLTMFSNCKNIIKITTLKIKDKKKSRKNDNNIDILPWLKIKKNQVRMTTILIFSLHI